MTLLFRLPTRRRGTSVQVDPARRQRAAVPRGRGVVRFPTNDCLASDPSMAKCQVDPAQSPTWGIAAERRTAVAEERRDH